MRRFALGSVLLLALFAWGCGSDDSPTGPTDPAGAAAEAALGDEALADGDIAGANAHYKAALAKDPNNAQANIGAAITEVYLLQSDAEIDTLIRWASDSLPNFPIRRGGFEASSRQVVSRVMAFGDTRFEPLSPVKVVARFATIGADDPPLLSEVQRVIKLKVMPKLAYAEACLNRVELHPTWKYLVPPAVTDQPDTVEIDLGEVYALDAVINAVQGWLGIAVAYNLDAPEQANPESLLAAGTDFGGLHADGALQLLQARNNLMLAKTRLDAAVAFIASETDNQEDDVIPRSELENPQFQEWLTSFNDVQTSLSAPVDVDVQDNQGNQVSVDVELGKFFTNSISDFKTKLPAHTFDVNHEPVLTEPLTFPDPEFNDIFPGMTNVVWRTLLGPPPPPVAVSRR